ncbi:MULTISPECIES: formate dehydrogenase accessory sulfurtransferase FdhD [Emticicia]|uniref:formate dehydrogenase accessory sulfurtransferase FdhD n=1 Tax=Emticicia TaxID=312278 RepID=UPI0007D8C7F9|nr:MULTISPECIES: formate dehydrogenase accessory sulfurtransferase FdhD [Emticicia]
MYGIKSFEIKKFGAKNVEKTPDLVAWEEPLEIRLGFGNEQNRQQKSISITMRTPTGHDFELALGFLFTEGIISQIEDILSIHYCTDAGRQAEQNIVRIELKPSIEVDFRNSERYFYATSSCGVCGKATIEAIEQKCPIIPKSDFKVSVEFIQSLLKILTKHQVFFQYTGGLHAAMIHSPIDNVGVLREDIGRHNALDKVIGAAFQANILPLKHNILVMSSRASFEIIQKAAMAGIPIIACVGAPSSLAIETAQSLGVTLIGFLRENGFNVYSHENRIE